MPVPPGQLHVRVPQVPPWGRTSPSRRTPAPRPTLPGTASTAPPASPSRSDDPFSIIASKFCWFYTGWFSGGRVVIWAVWVSRIFKPFPGRQADYRLTTDCVHLQIKSKESIKSEEIDVDDTNIKYSFTMTKNLFAKKLAKPTNVHCFIIKVKWKTFKH